MVDKKLNVDKVPNGGKFPNLRFPEFEKEWETRKLGEIAKFSKGKGISKNDIEENGKNECIRYGELYTHYGEIINEIKSKTNVDVTSLVLSKSNDVIIPSSGETSFDIAKASCVLKSGVILGGDLNIIQTCNNGVFLSYYLNSKKKKKIANLAQGVSVVHLYASQLASLYINFPEIEEQQKIATFLSLIDERLSLSSKIIENLETLIKGFFQNVFHNESYDFKYYSLKSLCSIKKGEQINSSELAQNGSYYVMNGGITPSGYYSNYNSEAEIISISEGGNSCGYVQYNYNKFWSGGHCYTLINVVETVVNKYLYYYLKAHEQRIMSLRVGSGLPNIQKSALELFSIKIPSIEEQIKIASFLSAIDQKIETEKAILEQLQLQKKYLLQNLFV